MRQSKDNHDSSQGNNRSSERASAGDVLPRTSRRSSGDEGFIADLFSWGSLYIVALVANVRQARGLGQGRRPSIRAGLQLLWCGQWKTFCQQLVANVRGGGAPAVAYALWRRRHQMTEIVRKQMRQEMTRWPNPPTFSVVLPVDDVAEQYLRRCIESVQRQIYPHWELCIADDASSNPHVRRALEQFAAKDPRIKVVGLVEKSGISAASNAALQLAAGPYVARLDADGELAEHALFCMAEAIVRDPSLDMLYSDEDKLTAKGKHVEPFFKPDWSPEYLLATNYARHLAVYRTERLRQIGGWRSQYDQAQDYDLVLRFAAGNVRIHHVPDVLYSWRMIPTSAALQTQAKTTAHQQGQKAVQAFVDASGRAGTVEPGPAPGVHRVRWAIVGQPLVSIVIPSACRKTQFRGRESWFVLECVSCIRRVSTYKNVEIIVLDNNDMSVELAAALQPLQIRCLPYTEKFNLSRKMNTGARAAKGEQLLFLNDDVEIINRDWIECMLEYSQWPEIGAVGAQLFYPNEMQQHNGVMVLNGIPGHPFYKCPASHPGYFYSSAVHRNWSAVTGACMMTPAAVFRQVGGFSEHFPMNYNDVDYCLKVGELGKRIVYVPYAKLYHHESASKSGWHVRELEMFQKTWAQRICHDPYYNPNLASSSWEFAIG